MGLGGKIIIKISISVTVLVVLMMNSVKPVSAATTFSFSPSGIDVLEGENFILTVSINPHEIKNFTVKAQIQYPADLLEVNWFGFTNIENEWVVLSQPEYSLIDNTNGILVKAASFPGGISEPVSFGNISFLAKKSGKGIIKIGKDSIALDASSQNVFDGSLIEASVAVSEEAPPLFDIVVEPAIKKIEGQSEIKIVLIIEAIIVLMVAVRIIRKMWGF